MVDPYKTRPRPEPFHSRALQDTLITPYRVLRGLNNFTITGISKVLAKAVLADIKSPANTTSSPATVTAYIEGLKTKGNTAFANKQ